MRRITPALACVIALLFSAGAARAQDGFTHEADEFTFELPSQTWRPVPRSDTAHTHTEFIYGDRLDGYLRVRKSMLESGESLSQMARREQDTKLRFVAGFVGGKEERFAGRLNGIVVGYEYTNAGKAMAGRIYYLQADNRTVYALHFTGLGEKLARIQNQTDSIARSFKLKQ
ncbi:MAG TPA: hypothetical protein VD968_09765 [Pyrinomonadaceae bacterium]|nr:hypothetical protein [Pyrinomonadaceae bacterium]